MQKKTLILGLALIGMQNTLATREPLSKEKIEKLKDELIEQKKRIDASGQKAM